MKTLILTTDENSYSTNRLAEETQKRGEQYEVINPSYLFSFVSATVPGHDRVYRKTDGKSERIYQKNFDAILPRVGGSLFQHSLMLIKQFNENMNTFSTASENGLRVCSNKLTTCQVLSSNRIRTPKQTLAHQPTDYKEIIDLVGGLPCVAKLQKGSLGDGVMLLETELAASTSLRSFEKLGASVILQQFINSGEPKSDLRIFVIGAETKEPKIYAYRRFSLDNDFRSNYTKSKLGETIEITEEEEEMALNAAKVLRLGVAGVDIIRDHNDNDKPYMIEVNGNPSLKGIEAVTKENVAGAIVDYILANYKKGGNSGSAQSLATSLNNQAQPDETKSNLDVVNDYIKDNPDDISGAIQRMNTL